MRKKSDFRRQPRGGYFLLFFALIITIISLPIMANVIRQTLDVQGNIAAFQKAEQVRTSGNGLLKAILQGIVVQFDDDGGLGYYQYFQTDDRYIDDGLTVEYLFSSASIVPVPTTNTLIGTSAVDPASLISGDPQGLGLIIEDAYDVADITDALGSDVQYVYTVPALGTGRAGDDCKFHRLNLGLNYPGGGDMVDPLDDPCNWNTLALGQTVSIPLYVRDPLDPNRIMVYKPSILKLRVRFKCEDARYSVCPPEERLVITYDEDGDFIEDLDIDTNELDRSPRVMNWIVSSVENFTPHVFWSNSSTTARSGDNAEITINKLRQESGDTLPFVRPIPRFEYVDGVSTVNFLVTGILNFYEAFSGGIDSEFGIEFQEYYDDPLANFISTDGIETGSAIGVSPVIGLYDEGFVGPALTFEFINGVYKGYPGDNNFDIRNINSLEYQIVSDVPLANYKYVMSGRGLSGDGSYLLTTTELRGPKASSPGLVFGN